MLAKAMQCHSAQFHPRLIGSVCKGETLNGWEQICPGPAFWDKRVSTDHPCGLLCFRSVIDSEKDYFCRWRKPTDFHRGLQTIHHRHGDIENNDIRLQLPNLVQGH